MAETDSIQPAELDWAALERLRAGFLQGTAGGRDYWQSDRDLASYDATFAQRIGWKWDHVLGELRLRGWTPPVGDVLDWGCGSGVAGRAYLDHFGVAGVNELRCWDRSVRAMGFAAAKARVKYPGLTVKQGLGNPPAVLLLSHVLSELQPEQTEALLAWFTSAACVLWVEPGDFATSYALIAVRERVRSSFGTVAPCTHGGACGMLAAGNERNWCHHFATPPGAVFTDPFWGKFAHLASVDLRSLPVSYLVMDKRPAPALPVETVRVIGRARLAKPYARVLVCNATGVQEVEVSKRHCPEAFRQFKREEFSSLSSWRKAGGQVVRFEPWRVQETTVAAAVAAEPQSGAPSA